MDKSVTKIIIPVVLIASFFMPWINFFGFGGSAFDLVMEVFKHFEVVLDQTPEALLSLLLLLFPICALVILIKPSDGKLLAKQLPFIFIIIVIVYGIIQLGSDAQILFSKDIFNIVGIGMWITIVSSAILFFDS